MTRYFRPLPLVASAPLAEARPLAGGRCYFTHAEELSRDAPPRLVHWSEIPVDHLEALTAPRPPIAGLDMGRCNVMGILNVTPDSFSDGGRFTAEEAARAHGAQMVADGADLIDIGGESTRPGARTVPAEEEIARVVPPIRALAGDVPAPISIDTRKAAVASAAVAAGAALVNDVAGFTFDPELAPFCARNQLPVCVMHAQGDPETMQQAPRYDNVLLDVYDFLAARISALEAAGIPRGAIIVDPGIGFGKTLDHNLALLNGISLFHGLGCAVLLGASRKRFIGTLSGVAEADRRGPGSIAAALFAAGQGVQILRVHDVAATCQALRVWEAMERGNSHDA